MQRATCVVLSLLVVGCPRASAQDATGESSNGQPALPDAAAIEAAGAVIGEIIFDKQNVFDPTNPKENNALFRLANRWHIVTRDVVIARQLLFRTGEPFSVRLIEESERLLRRNDYLYDAKITPVRFENGVVDVRVWTRDLWTLMPGLSVSRSGGENRSRVSMSERNLLGHGVSVKINYVDDVDRETTNFEYRDRNLGSTWWSLLVNVADKSDGDTLNVNLNRPFYSLDSRWSAGMNFHDDERRTAFYELGNEVAEYRVESRVYNAFVGWSSGLKNGWVRRWTAGIQNDEQRFLSVDGGSLPDLVPDDRILSYPFIGFELLQDKFESTSNRDQIDRTEDFYLGTRFSASIGFATEGLGADRESLIYRAFASRGFGSMEKKALLFSASLAGRSDHGRTADRRVGFNARYYNKINDKRLVFASIDASHGKNLDVDGFFQLGGDSGLRGYPLRYQTGDARLLVSAEQRYYTDWYPFRLVRVGGAIFFDAGRTWGNNPAAGAPLGWLKDVGIGLRLVPTRSSGREVIHFDLAFPLDGDASIDDVQILLESKRSF